MLPEKTKFAEIQLEIERTLVQVRLAEGEDKRLLLRRLNRLIAEAYEAISSSDPVAASLTIREDLVRLRNLVRIAMGTDDLNLKT